MIGTALPLLGAANGALLAIAAWGTASGGKRCANRFLALTLLCAALGLTYSALEGYGLLVRYPHLIMAGAPLSFIFGPSLYLYARFLCAPSLKPRATVLLHFLPALAHQAILIPFHLLPGDEKLIWWEEGRSFPSLFYAVALLQAFHAAAYLCAVEFLLLRRRKAVRENLSTRERREPAWLRRLIAGALLVALIYAAALVHVSSSGGSGAYINGAGDAAVVVLLHILGIFALLQPELLHDIPAPPAADRGRPAGRYGKSAMDPDEAERVFAAADAYLRSSRAYVHEEFSLADLAQDLNETTHRVSQAIHRAGGTSFYEYINGLRCDFAARILADPASHAGLLDLMSAAGFRSKSTFNGAFKKRYGTTPSAYRAKFV